MSTTRLYHQQRAFIIAQQGLISVRCLQPVMKNVRKPDIRTGMWDSTKLGARARPLKPVLVLATKKRLQFRCFDWIRMRTLYLKRCLSFFSAWIGSLFVHCGWSCNQSSLRVRLPVYRNIKKSSISNNREKDVFQKRHTTRLANAAHRSRHKTESSHSISSSSDSSNQ